MSRHRRAAGQNFHRAVGAAVARPQAGRVATVAAPPVGSTNLALDPEASRPVAGGTVTWGVPIELSATLEAAADVTAALTVG